jgi:ABC-type nitrate/sulfonate/bicarbonate transport system substrate-binding protein
VQQIHRVFSSVIFFLIIAVSARAADVVHVGLAGLSGNLIHPFVAKDTGIFQKYGIDARLVVFEGGSLLSQAAIAGEVKFSVRTCYGDVSIPRRRHDYRRELHERHAL